MYYNGKENAYNGQDTWYQKLILSERGKYFRNSKIAKSMKLDRKTVQKYVDKKDFNEPKQVMQINHAGNRTLKESNNNHKGSSADKDEIKEIVNNFRKAAIRVKEAGFDGVEIHSSIRVSVKITDEGMSLDKNRVL